jgi:8-oxo-dGDP phosphatase
VSDDEQWRGAIRDEVAPQPIVDSHDLFQGHVWSVRRDHITFSDQHIERDVLVHPGAVAVIAMNADDEILLIRQYRHPVASMLLEPPAGLLDKPGENPIATAQRELAEEAGYTASTWHTLVDLMNSPGGSTEAIRIYLARGVHAIPGGRIHTGEAEENFLPRVWVPLNEAVRAVLAGELQSPTAVAGILAVAAHRPLHSSPLRPADAPWSTREALVQHNRVHNHRTEAK